MPVTLFWFRVIVLILNVNGTFYWFDSRGQSATHSQTQKNHHRSTQNFYQILSANRNHLLIRLVCLHTTFSKKTLVNFSLMRLFKYWPILLAWYPCIKIGRPYHHTPSTKNHIKLIRIPGYCRYRRERSSCTWPSRLRSLPVASWPPPCKTLAGNSSQVVFFTK